MKAMIHVGPVEMTLHYDDEVFVCDPNARLSSTKPQGYFIADTRLASGYRLKIGRAAPVLLNSSEVAQNSARFEYTNEEFIDDEGTVVAENTLHLRLDRVLGRGVHEDYDLTNFSNRPITLVLEVSVESDFADLFDVKEKRLQRRGLITTNWDEATAILVNSFVNGGFVRSIQFEAVSSGAKPVYANGGLAFSIILQPNQTWNACLIWRPTLSDQIPLATNQVCHDLLGGAKEMEATEPWMANSTRFFTSNPNVNATVQQALDDLIGLRMRLQLPKSMQKLNSEIQDQDLWLPAAGIPWFVSVFGRDALTVSLQSLHVSYKFAEGSLKALSVLQATETDDERDMQPGKIEHELRLGELAELGLVPHTPYYGTHDATPLFVLTAAQTWKWHGDISQLNRIRPHVEAALGWIDKYGDIDNDGLQEYATKSSSGYFNQGWKDDGTAIVHADGSYPELPIATCEIQGLVVAAKRAWADVVFNAYGEKGYSQKLNDEADRLSYLIETKFFWAEQNTYFLGLDGNKNPIESVASNAGQLLYYEAIEPERAAILTKRLFEEDLWSGWGIRTLSSMHPSYNPFSYQTGSVWPHDNVLIADGMRKYGFDTEAQRIAKAMFDAAECFVNRRLPELFSGLKRDEASFPVQFLGANVPQAWASGAVVHMISMLLGLKPNAKDGLLAMSPALPEWLEKISLSGLPLGDKRIDFEVERIAGKNHNLKVDSYNSENIVLES